MAFALICRLMIRFILRDLDRRVKYLKAYAQDYSARPQLFLQAPNRKSHFPYVLRVLLCENDEEIRGLLEFSDAS